MSTARRPDHLYQALSFPMRAKLLAAVFFTFAPLSVLLVSRFEAKRSWLALACYAALGGFTAVGWAYAFMRTRKFFWILIPTQLLWFILPAFVFRSDFRNGFTLSLEGSACIAAIVTGYILFIHYIRREGAKSIRLQTELTLASEIHANLIPPVHIRTPYLELFGRSEACNEMGGDLLDVIVDGDSVGAYIADVSGHGVRAGVVMAMTKAAVRMKLRSTTTLDELLNDLNVVQCDLIRGGMFVTAACMRFTRKPDRIEAEFVGAGHGPVLHWRAGSKDLGHIESEHLPLGVVKTEVYELKPVSLTTGDLLLFMTDGLFEVFDDDGRVLGQEPIEAALIRHADQPLEELYLRVMETVRAHGPRIDDQTLLLVRVT